MAVAAAIKAGDPTAFATALSKLSGDPRIANIMKDLDSVADARKRAGLLLVLHKHVRSLKALSGEEPAVWKALEATGEAAGSFYGSLAQEWVETLLDPETRKENTSEDEDKVLAWHVKAAELMVRAEDPRADNHIVEARKRSRALRREQKPLNERLDIVRAERAEQVGQLIDAAIQYHRISKWASDGQAYLRKSALCILRTDPLLEPRPYVAAIRKVSADERAPRLKEWPLLEFMASKRMIGKRRREELIALVQSEKGFDRERLEKVFAAHSLEAAAALFSSVSVARLAELVGWDEQVVVEAIGRMIRSGQVNARIDEPAAMVWYAAQRSDDDRIREFCQSVDTLVRQIAKK